MVKRFIASLAAGALLLSSSAALPALAHHKAGHTKPPAHARAHEKAKHFKMVAKIMEVDATNKVLKLRKRGTQTVNVANALIVVVTAHAASVGTLTDLKPGDKVFLLVEKENGPEKKLTALLVIKGLPGGLGGGADEEETNGTSTPSTGS